MLNSARDLPQTNSLTKNGQAGAVTAQLLRGLLMRTDVNYPPKNYESN